MSIPIQCEFHDIGCWGGGYNSWPIGIIPPPFYPYTGGYDNMPTFGGGNNNPNTHNENPDGTVTFGGNTYNPVTGQLITNPVALPIVTNDLLTRIKSFANENPVIVIGGVALVALLLLKK